MIIFENKFFMLKLGEDGVAKSLVLKATGEECLDTDNDMPLFSITEKRPYNNEIKLIYPNKKTTFSANKVERQGNRLIVSFELVSIQAIIEVLEKDEYISFKFVDFIVPENAFNVGCPLILPAPVQEVRILQLPVLERENFGNWLNVVWDKTAAINVISANPYAIVDSEKRKNTYVMSADALKEAKLKGCEAALVVCPPENLLDCIEKLERDFGLPLGAEKRRSEGMDESIYWTDNINPKNVDEHIACAKCGGFSRILVYYPAFFKEDGYRYTGDYDFNENYPNGYDDIKLVIDKIKEAGIMPGFHFLHPHIGIKSRYVTPVADHRLNLTEYFTLSKDIDENADCLYVEQNPEGAPLTSAYQVLKFDGEIIYYDSYETEYPYCFKGLKRGYYDTNIIPHKKGTIGGVLDVSEFGAQSVYTDERTSLQDEVQERLVKAYNQGFEFIYFDGSEGTNPPFEFNVPYAQYRVYRKLDKEPMFCEGAAKANFGWHMLSGGNAFDVFPAKVFKEKIAEYPLSAVALMRNNFTRLNFGWWAFDKETQPDMYEYGTSKAAACNCPITVMADFKSMDENPRKDDILEVLKGWEDVRRKKWLTDEQKEMLKNPDNEYILLKDEKDEYSLVQYYPIRDGVKEDGDFSAFYFEYSGRNYVVCWHTKGEGKLFVPFAEDFKYEEKIGGNIIDTEISKEGCTIPLSGRKYFSTASGKEKLVKAFENAKIND